MAEKQRIGISGSATIRAPVFGEVSIGKSSVRELRFMPRSSFPDVGQPNVLYVDTDESFEYWWNGERYVQISGSNAGVQIDDDGVYTTKTWSSSKINSELDTDQAQIDNMAYEKISNIEIDAILNL